MRHFPLQTWPNFVTYVYLSHPVSASYKQQPASSRRKKCTFAVRVRKILFPATHWSKPAKRHLRKWRSTWSTHACFMLLAVCVHTCKLEPCACLTSVNTLARGRSPNRKCDFARNIRRPTSKFHLMSKSTPENVVRNRTMEWHSGSTYYTAAFIARNPCWVLISCVWGSVSRVCCVRPIMG